MKYNKEQVNPLSRKWEEVGIATLTDEEAETLNAHSKHTNIRYVAVEEKKKQTKK